jgi:hypothetical protein
MFIDSMIKLGSNAPFGGALELNETLHLSPLRRTAPKQLSSTRAINISPLRGENRSMFLQAWCW